MELKAEPIEESKETQQCEQPFRKLKEKLLDTKKRYIINIGKKPKAKVIETFECLFCEQIVCEPRSLGNKF